MNSPLSIIFCGILTFFGSPTFAKNPSEKIIPPNPVCTFSLQIQILSDFNNFAVSCSDTHDGRAKVSAVGSAEFPLEIYWESGEIQPVAEKLAGGWASVSVTDASGCRVVDSVFLKKPDQFVPKLTVFGEKCLGTADGRIEIIQKTGGVEPFIFSINNQTGLLNDEIAPLESGSFLLEITDLNDCRDTFGVLIPSGLPFGFDLGLDTASIFSSDTFSVDFSSIFGVDSLFWSPENLVSGTKNARFFPQKTTIFQATAKNALGCSATDDFILTVNHKRGYYFPNIIWRHAVLPENRFFTIYTSGGISEIERLEIYDRWGNLVFLKKNFPSSVSEEGFDGIFRGKKVEQGVFVFRAIIRQTNGLAKLYLGDFSIFD
jgi:CHU_C Type IX secretion signal domain